MFTNIIFILFFVQHGTLKAFTFIQHFLFGPVLCLQA